tara:strand:+ start:3795 stop:5807 length:2013 start_codon:yes stop_codon:yes gene_type:complete
MKNLYKKIDKIKFVSKFNKNGIPKDLAERIYTSRLLGANPDLVLHGGGNTSVKSMIRDVDEEIYDVIYIKGSGSDLGSIGPQDFPAVKIDPLMNLMKKKFVTDEEMVSYIRKNLINISSPNPSVETLVHAIIKEKFVDHTHSNSILEITDRPDGLKLSKNLFGKNFIIIPYIMPGYLLARKVYKMYRQDKEIHGLILFKHGIFTFADSAEESYGRMINAVSTAENFLNKQKTKKISKIKTKITNILPTEIAPIIRGYLSSEKTQILNFRTNSSLLSAINSRDIELFLKKGVITPDHVIRTKPVPLVMNIDKCNNSNDFRKLFLKKLSSYRKNYIKYFTKNSESKKMYRMLNPLPQIIIIQNMGIFSLGRNLQESIINGDISETSIKTIYRIEKKSKFISIPSKDIFDVEYWSLEQAKLKKVSLPLEGKITVITGGKGTIGFATAEKFKKMGAEVVLLDLNNKKLINEDFDYYHCDVTKRSEVKKVLLKISKKYGGLDIVISNAGNAFQHEIATLSDSDLHKSFEINFFSHQIVASESVLLMKKQNLGGCLLFNISKQSVNPGVNFGSYGLPKSALLFLCKQYALEYGHLGIRANGINADRIVSGLLTKKMILKRSKSRNLSITDYLKGNLLGEQVFAEDVANAFYSLSVSHKTTAAVLSVDGGNIEASMR